jgi:hypothetical protein
VSDQDEFREFAAVAEMVRERHGVVGIILEAKIFRFAEFRLPAAGAALVIAKRRYLSRSQLLREFFQGGRIDSGSVAVPVGGAGARDQ